MNSSFKRDQLKIHDWQYFDTNNLGNNLEVRIISQEDFIEAFFLALIEKANCKFWEKYSGCINQKYK